MYNIIDLDAGPAGARELIAECQDILAGQREHFTPLNDYLASRRAYWQARLAGEASASEDERAA